MDPCGDIENKNMSWAKCIMCYEDEHDIPFQKALDEVMPWIGMYIVVASAVCGMAMAVDVFNGLRTKQLWFPCKYFSLNATFLMLLAVALKLTMDQNSTKVSNGSDVCAGFSSVVLMSSAMSNFMTSLASMDDRDALLNLTALGILIVTVDVNVWVYDNQTDKVYKREGPYFDDYVCGFIFLLLILLCNLAIVARTTKRYVETKFWEMHEKVLNEREQGTKFTAKELSEILKKYWVMAGTGNPQFVMARSAICVIPGVICLSMTITLLVMIGIYKNGNDLFFHSDSNYEWSINWILLVQTVGAVFGTIAPTSRLFLAARFRSSRADFRSFKEELETEPYWTRRLIDWKEYSIPLRIRDFKCKNILHISKRVILNSCIKIQIMIVLTSKLILIISSWIINVPFKFIHSVIKLRRHVLKFTSDRRGHGRGETGTNELDYRPFVMLLEGELKLPNWIIANISKEADKLLHVGKMRKPKNLIELLQKSENFNGVSIFDRKNVKSLHVQEPRDCWSLTLVTLTSIAVSLPNISSNIVNKLFDSVSESLPIVMFIVEKLDKSGELLRIRKTADCMFGQLELKKWQDNYDVQGNNMNGQTYKEKLRELSTTAKKTITEFKPSKTDPVMNNPLNWSIMVIAANSMYRVCESLLLIEIDGIEDNVDQIFFERLTIIISDILGACLTNLAHVLFTECYTSSIEKRQENIRRALILLGENEEIIQCLEQREWPDLCPDKAGDIEEWQDVMRPCNEIPVNFVSTTNVSSAPHSSNGEVVINVGSSGE